jgi:hypothetical protein
MLQQTKKLNYPVWKQAVLIRIGFNADPVPDPTF